MKRFMVSFLIFSLITSGAQAATKKPTPKPTSKILTKPNAKVTTKVVKKPVVKKKKTYVAPKKRRVRKTVKPLPSPSPSWPPANFKSDNSNSVFAKVPSADELKGAASNSLSLSADLKKCEIQTCGSVFVASVNTCNYWEVNSILYKSDGNQLASKTALGSLRTITKGSKAKEIKPILMISDQPLDELVSVGGIIAKCWNSNPGSTVPSNIYTPYPQTK